MATVLIIEDSPAHSETLGFFIQACSRMGHKIYVYMGTPHLGDTYLGDLAQIFSFHFFNDQSLLRTVCEKLTPDDLVIVNSARNFKSRASSASEAQRFLRGRGFPVRRLIVQCHNGSDKELEFIQEVKPTLIAASPVFNREIEAKFLPVFDALGTRQHPLAPTDQAAVFMVGGMAPHARDHRELTFIPDMTARPRTSLFVCCRQAHISDLAPGALGVDLEPLILSDWTGSSIGQYATRFRSFVAINLKPSSVYHTRLLSGSIPFSINYGIPVMADAEIVRKYDLPFGLEGDFSGPAVCDFLDRNVPVYDDLHRRWQDFRLRRIETEQSSFLSFVAAL